MTRAWQITHYTNRLASAKSAKERDFLHRTLSGLKTNPDDTIPSVPYNLIIHHSPIPRHQKVGVLRD